MRNKIEIVSMCPKIHYLNPYINKEKKDLLKY